MPEYYTKLLYMWRDGLSMYALMARWKKWFIVERELDNRLRLEDLYKKA